MSKQDLNRGQARWSTFLSRFNYKIQYRPGRLGMKPDVLTRRSEDLPMKGDLRLLNQSQTLLKHENLDSQVCRDMNIQQGLSGEGILPVLAAAEAAPQPPPTSTDNYTSFEREVLAAYKNNPVTQKILHAIKNGIRKIRELSIGECTLQNNLIYYRDRSYIPDDSELCLQVLRKYYDLPRAEHPGRDKTFYLISRTLFWPNMWEHIS